MNTKSDDANNSYELQHTAVDGEEQVSQLLSPLLKEIEAVCNAALENAVKHNKRPLQFRIRVIAGRIHIEVRGIPIGTTNQLLK